MISGKKVDKIKMISLVRFDQCRRSEKKYRNKNYCNKGKTYIWHIMKHFIHETQSFRENMVILWKIRNTIIYKNTLEKELLFAGKYIFK